MKDKKVKSLLKKNEQAYREARSLVKRAQLLHTQSHGFIEPENIFEKTYKIRQEDISKAVPLTSAQKVTPCQRSLLHIFTS